MLAMGALVGRDQPLVAVPTQVNSTDTTAAAVEDPLSPPWSGPSEHGQPTAERDTIPPETAVVAGNLTETVSLQPGQPRAILPGSGVSYGMHDGEMGTLLAERHDAGEAAIPTDGPYTPQGGGEVVPGPAPASPAGGLPAALTREPAPEAAARPAPEPIAVAAAPAPIGSAPIAASATPPAALPPPPSQPALPPAPPAEPPVTAGLATGRMVWPTTGQVTTHFTYTGGRGHNGLDIANDFGTPIVAADGGVVTWAGWRNDGLGIAVFIDHGNGLQTWYGHCTRAVVQPGQPVSKGQVIGTMGSTGKSTGSHLHFMVLQDNSYRDPLSYLDGRGTPAQGRSRSFAAIQ